MQIAIVVFGILTAAATGLTIIGANRLSALQATETTELRRRLEATEATAVAAKGHLGQRALSATQEHELLQLLTSSGVPTRIPIICSESSEALIFGRQLTLLLQNAGWNTEPQPGTASPAWHGLILTVEDPAEPPRNATLLAQQLGAYGFPVTVTGRGGAPKVRSVSSSKTLGGPPQKLDLLNLWVGDRPPL